MTHWFRFYDDAVNDPKVQRLPGEKFKAWVNLLCVASKNDGALPPMADIAFNLRISEEKVFALLDYFCDAGLIDMIAPLHYEPHNWGSRQYKSDTKDPTAAERNKRYRNRKRNDRNASVTLTDTRTETEQSTDSVAEEATGAIAPIDHRKRLFNEGLKKLSVLTGKGPDACRAFAGKCLQAAGDDAVTVMGLIEDAERNQVINPSAWIAARLKPVEIGNGKPKNGVIAAIDDLNRTIASFDGPAGGIDELRSGEGETPPRLLS